MYGAQQTRSCGDTNGKNVNVVSHGSCVKFGCGDMRVHTCIVFCDAWFREFGGGIFTFMNFEGDSGVLLTQGKKNYCY